MTAFVLEYVQRPRKSSILLFPKDIDAVQLTFTKVAGGASVCYCNELNYDIKTNLARFILKMVYFLAISMRRCYVLLVF